MGFFELALYRFSHIGSSHGDMVGSEDSCVDGVV